MFDQFNNRSVPAPQTGSPISVDVQPVLRLTYLWMSFGLLTTAVIAWLTANTAPLLALALNPVVSIVALLGSLGLVFALSLGINRMSANMAMVLFFVYATVLGFTLSSIFVVYTPGAIANALFTTAVLFGGMTVIGFTTNIDLSKYGSYLMIGLVGIIGASIVNIFIGSSAFDFAISIFGVVLFTALTAYDTQKIKNMAQNPEFLEVNDTVTKISILGALTLYLDFINLFLFLLRLFGGGRD